MRAWLRHPLLHFLVLGGLLYALAPASPAARPRLPPRIAADAASPPDEVLLLERARALGFHRTDGLVRRRLVRNMRFVSGAAGGDDDALFHEALALELDRSDLVVQRRLVQKMRLRVFEAARAREPTEVELARYLRRHARRFTEPPRAHLSHVFLSRDRRGIALEDDARDLRAVLVADGVTPDDCALAGDPFLLGAHLPSRSRGSLARSFGSGFAEAVFAAEPGVWSAPIASSYGLHLVWLHKRVPARPASLGAVRGRVREALLAELGETALDDLLRTLRARRRG